MTYETWRITFQSSEQAARSAFKDAAIAHEKYLRLLSDVKRALDKDRLMVEPVKLVTITNA